jgi:hypothetical protein
MLGSRRLNGSVVAVTQYCELAGIAKGESETTRESRVVWAGADVDALTRIQSVALDE